MDQNKMKSKKILGKQSILFDNPPIILSAAAIAGKKEGEGPLGSFFDQIEEILCLVERLGKKRKVL